MNLIPPSSEWHVRDCLERSTFADAHFICQKCGSYVLVACLSLWKWEVLTCSMLSGCVAERGEERAQNGKDLRKKNRKQPGFSTLFLTWWEAAGPTVTFYTWNNIFNYWEWALRKRRFCALHKKQQPDYSRKRHITPKNIEPNSVIYYINTIIKALFLLYFHFVFLPTIFSWSIKIATSADIQTKYFCPPSNYQHISGLGPQLNPGFQTKSWIVFPTSMIQSSLTLLWSSCKYLVAHALFRWLKEFL